MSLRDDLIRGIDMYNAVEEKSFAFAVRIVKLCKYLQSTQNEFVLTKQLLRAGTSIGANVAEAQQAQSRADFVSKLNIALKECVETEYWLRLLLATELLEEVQFHSLHSQCLEIKKLLVSIIKSSKLSEYSNRREATP